MRQLLLLAPLLLLLGACDHLSEMRGRPAASIPPVPPPPAVCPGPAAAEPIAEPLPPSGFTEEDFAAALVATFGPDLGEEIHGWLMARWRPWAREGWARAQAAHDFCKTVNAAPAK